jgi:hypothetical protein
MFARMRPDIRKELHLWSYAMEAAGVFDDAQPPLFHL